MVRLQDIEISVTNKKDVIEMFKKFLTLVSKMDKNNFKLRAKRFFFFKCFDNYKYFPPILDIVMCKGIL